MLNDSLSVSRLFEILLLRILCLNLYTIFKLDYLFTLMSSFLSSLCIFGISPLSDLGLMKIFSYYVGFHFFTPFDLTEGESELVSGFNVEHAAGAFLLTVLSALQNFTISG